MLTKNKNYWNYAKALLVLVCGAALSIGISYVHAQTAIPPGGNLPAVITRLPVAQVKNGGLSVNAFSATGYSYFAQDASFKGIVRGDAPGASSTIQFGGTIGGVSWPVEAFVTGSLEATGALHADPLANTTNKKLCAGIDGKIVVCN
jgi:hypothetical protein